MTSGEAITTCFKKYVTFRGRAGTSEFWWFFVFTLFWFTLATAGDIWLFLGKFGEDLQAVGLQEEPLEAFEAFFNILLQYNPSLMQVPVIFLTLPMLAVGARRMHDYGSTGWRQLPVMFPFLFGSIFTAFGYLMQNYGIFDDATILLPAFLTMGGGATLAFAQFDRMGDAGRNAFGPPPPR